MLMRVLFQDEMADLWKTAELQATCRRCFCHSGPGAYGLCEVKASEFSGSPVPKISFSTSVHIFQVCFDLFRFVHVLQLLSCSFRKSSQAWQDCRTVISFLMGALVCHCARTSRGRASFTNPRLQKHLRVSSDV